MNREDIIRMAREAGVPLDFFKSEYNTNIERFAALVAAAEREKVTFEMVDEAQRAVQESVAAEREACAKVAGWLWHQFQDTKEAHERNSPEPFRPERFGFDQSTVQQSKRMMDAIRARGEMK